MNTNRQKVIQNFLKTHKLAQYTIKPLAQDASFRRYFRLKGMTKTFILMDAPPEHEDIKPFINIAQHLSSINLRAPEILQFDLENGFILLEDFGDDTFTRLLTNGTDELSLYQLALQSLINLQAHPNALDIELPIFSNELLITEACLLTDWYYNSMLGKSITSCDRSNYIDCWQQILDQLPQLPNTLVLRDFHVDNLIQLPKSTCGLLDFQDAVIGSSAYDLVSLLEDARRDVSLKTQQILKQQFFDHFTNLNQDDFMRCYHVLGAQRHCKVLGIFTRLVIRDKKPHYLNHINRVTNLLVNKLEQDDLSLLKTWFKRQNLLEHRKNY